MAAGEVEVRFVAVARVVAPHGVRGEVRVEALTDDPARLGELGPCRLRLPDGRVRQVQAVGARRGPHQSHLLRFQEITSRSEAEELRGAYVEIPVEQVRPLPEGRYYLFQVVGLPVFDESGRRLGSVREVRRCPAHDIWVVAPEGGGRAGRGGELWVPAVREMIREVDLTGRRVVVRLPEGLQQAPKGRGGASRG